MSWAEVVPSGKHGLLPAASAITWLNKSTPFISPIQYPAWNIISLVRFLLPVVAKAFTASQAGIMSLPVRGASSAFNRTPHPQSARSLRTQAGLEGLSEMTGVALGRLREISDARPWPRLEDPIAMRGIIYTRRLPGKGCPRRGSLGAGARARS